MVDKNRNDISGKNEELVSENNVLNKFQIFLDNNIRIIRVSCESENEIHCKMKNEFSLIKWAT